MTKGRKCTATLGRERSKHTCTTFHLPSSISPARWTHMKEVGESLEVTLQYGGIKGERMWSSKHDAIGVLLADLVVLRVHRPKGENIRQEGATFFLSWYHHAYAPTPLERGTLYPRWRDIVLGNPELNATKKMLSIESVTLCRYHGDILIKMLGPAPSSLGPKHKIEPPRTDAMNSRTSLFSPSPSTGRPYHSQRPYLMTDATREKRPRSNSIHEQDLPRSVGNEECPPAHLQKRIRIEPNHPAQSSPVEGRDVLNNAASGDCNAAPEVRNKVPPSRPASLVPPSRPRASLVPPSRPPTSLASSLAPLSTTNQREQCNPSSFDTKSLSNLSGVGNRIVPTGPRPPERRESIKKNLLDLSKVRNGLATLHSREKCILEELARLGVSPQPPQPKIEEINSSPNALEAQLMLVEVALQQEKKQRLRAEHTLAEVERECRSPFVVPALFQAFRGILDIGHVGATTSD